jgi:hypothetical protein
MTPISQALAIPAFIYPPSAERPRRYVLLHLIALISMLLVTVVAVRAQDPAAVRADPSAQVIDGVVDGNAWGLGKSIKITGHVKQGAVAFGGDVIVEGTVDGDVAAIGGSVIQLDGARIGGDVLVFGGAYHHAAKLPDRNPASTTIMYAGYEQELHDMMRSPSSFLSPRWSPTSMGLRLLAILFWFIISLALTAAMPGAVSRGVARLQLTSLRVAIIGLLGAVVVSGGVTACLSLLPGAFSAMISIMVLLLFLVAGVFGRVVIYAATGRWLQRRYFPMISNSESMALLVGIVFWAILSSLPYIWPLTIGVMIVLSLGLALTAGRGDIWKKARVA